MLDLIHMMLAAVLGLTFHSQLLVGQMMADTNPSDWVCFFVQC